MGSITDSSAENVSASLKGKIMHVPNLYDLFNSWPAKEVNHNYEKMRLLLNGVIDE